MVAKPTAYDIRMAAIAEPYENDGLLGYAIPLEQGHWEARLLEDWKEVSPEIENLLENRPVNPWYLPSKPDVSDDLSNLYIEFNQILGEYVWFADDRNSSLVSNWILTSYVFDLHEYSPRIYLHATTRSGKSHCLEAINQLSYHGLRSLVNPTQAVLYRMIQNLHPTITMDETQDQDKNPELAIGIDTIFKAGFQKGSMTARCEEKGPGFIYYDLFSPMAVASKKAPKEDLINRSFPINMLTASKEASKELKRRFDKDWATELRGRALAFRMNALTGKIPIEELIQQAIKLAEGEIFVGDSPEAHLLDGRSIDKAIPLLTTGAYFHDTQDILELLVNSEKVSAQNMGDTFEGQIMHAFQECLVPSLMGIPRSENLEDISITQVRDQLETDLAMQGNSRKDRIMTRSVGNNLRNMGFKFKAGTDNKSFFTPDDFDRVYASNCEKYGYRNGLKARYSLKSVKELSATSRQTGLIGGN